MKYLLSIALAGLLSAMVAIPALADSGVTISLTTTITGGGGGSSGGFDVGGGGSSLTLESQFPQLKQQPQSSSPYIPPEIPYIPLPQTTHSTVLQNGQTNTQQTQETPQPLNGAVVAGIVFGSIAIGLIVWGIYYLINKRRNNYEQ